MQGGKLLVLTGLYATYGLLWYTLATGKTDKDQLQLVRAFEPQINLDTNSNAHGLASEKSDIEPDSEADTDLETTTEHQSHGIQENVGEETGFNQRKGNENLADDENTKKFTVQRLRTEQIQTLQKHPIFSHFLIVPDSLNQRFYVDRKSNVGFCTILKNMSTMMLALFCKREGTMSVHHTPRLHGPTTYYGCAKELPRVSANTAAEWDNSDWKFWTLVRDPFGRWLSAWADQCMHRRTATKCYGCNGDPSCFLSRLREVLLALMHGNPVPHQGSLRPGDHFFPQMWSCTLYQHYKQFDKIFHYNKTEEFKSWFRDQFACIGYGPELLQRGWNSRGDDKFMDAQSANAAGTRKNARKMQTEQQMRNSVELMELYLSIYLIDHVFLRYPLPSFTTDLCNQCQQQQGRTNCERMLVCLVSHEWANMTLSV